MIASIIFIFLGFAILILGASWLVDGASQVARRFNISDLAIGLTIVAFGTSAPELVVNVMASAGGYSDIVMGNVLGSNNFNLFIILGLAGLIYPIKIRSRTALIEIPISLAVAVLLLLLINDFQFSGQTSLSGAEGLLLLIVFGLFLYYVFSQARKETPSGTVEHSMTWWKEWGLIIGGLAGLILGGQMVVANSVVVGETLGVSKKIIGLTVVAAGTSLPELVTSLVAAFKKNSDIAIGNVVGSNIFNILLILSLSSIVDRIEYNPRFNLDLYVLIAGTIFLLTSMITGERKKLDRWEAGVLLCFYLGYVAYLVVGEL